MSGYRELKVWQLNQVCVKDTLSLMKSVPGDYALQHIGKQLFRAISSVGANLAEGHESYDGKEYVRYINIAIRSAIESDHWLATLENILGEKESVKKLTSANTEVIKMLKGLKRAIEEKRPE